MNPLWASLITVKMMDAFANDGMYHRDCVACVERVLCSLSRQPGLFFFFFLIRRATPASTPFVSIRSRLKTSQSVKVLDPVDNEELNV